MEWLYIIGAIWLGAYIWEKVTTKDKKPTPTYTPRPQYQPPAPKPKTTSEIAKKLNTRSVDLENITLSHEQKAVFKKLEETNDIIYVTGKAGTGKSVLLQYFTEYTSKQVAVVAPTGVAALNIGGMTIHSFFRLPPEAINLDDIEVDYKTKEILRHLDAVVIDEVSMVRVDLMEAISIKMQLAKGNDLPFGGVQVIMFGDLYQLPPVVSDGQLHRYFNDSYGGVYFFNAPSIQKSGIKIYELNNIFRQKDPEFKAVLNSIREGKNIPSALEKVNARLENGIPEDGVVVLAGTNSVVHSINHKKLSALPGEEKIYHAVISGSLQESSFPTEKELKLKPGAQVMMLRNDREKPRRWVNGTLGIVTKLGEDSIRVNINGVEHNVLKETWKKIRYYYDHEEAKLEKETISEFTQFPVRLAWAITIHKSQGQTYQSVAVDLTHGAFTHGQTYVALSRCKSLDGLYLKSALQREDVIVDSEIVDFMKDAVILETA